jgi:hypothetical protein
MKCGDLVRMKRRMFWVLKGNRHQRYTEQPLLVMEGWHSAVKLIYPDGTVKTDLAENYEAIDEVS